MIPGTGISGLIHMIARRPYVAAVIGVVCLSIGVPITLPLVRTETLPPHVFVITPPKVTMLVTPSTKIKNHHSRKASSKSRKGETRS
jgi:hypothetical protein